MCQTVSRSVSIIVECKAYTPSTQPLPSPKQIVPKELLTELDLLGLSHISVCRQVHRIFFYPPQARQTPRLIHLARLPFTFIPTLACAFIPAITFAFVPVLSFAFVRRLPQRLSLLTSEPELTYGLLNARPRNPVMVFNFVQFVQNFISSFEDFLNKKRHTFALLQTLVRF